MGGLQEQKASCQRKSNGLALVSAFIYGTRVTDGGAWLIRTGAEGWLELRGTLLAVSHTCPGQAWHCPQYSGGSINLLDKRARNWGEEKRRANPRAWGSGGNWTASTNWEDGFRTTACIKDHKTFPVCGTKRHPGWWARANGLFLPGPWESGNPWWWA